MAETTETFPLTNDDKKILIYALSIYALECDRLLAEQPCYKNYIAKAEMRRLRSNKIHALFLLDRIIKNCIVG